MIPVRTRFLLADDDADDTSLFCEALCRVAPVMECYKAENGRQVFEFLAQGRPGKPDIIFLDINMPIMNGWDCLKKLKEDPKLSDIPVIVYSTSSARRDIDMAYSLGALLFLTKPAHFEELCKILEIVATNPQDNLRRNLGNFQSIKMK